MVGGQPDPCDRHAIGKQQIPLIGRKPELAFQNSRAKAALGGDGGSRRAALNAERIGRDAHFDLAIADGLACPLAGLTVDRLQEQLGVAAGEHGFGYVRAVAIAHLAKRLKGEHDRRAELAALGQEPREVLDARQVGKLVEHEPDAALGRWRKAEYGAGGAFKPAGHQRLGRFEIVFLARDEDPRLRALDVGPARQ